MNSSDDLFFVNASLIQLGVALGRRKERRALTKGLLTWNFEIDANPPVCLSFGAIYVQIPEAYLPHRFHYRASILVSCNSDLLISFTWVKCVDQMKVAIIHLTANVRWL